MIPEHFHVQVFNHIRKGQMLLVAEAGEQNTANTVRSRAEYQILITHKSGDIQTLHFDDVRAAKATFEFMKYEVQANRISLARLVRYINGKYDKQLDFVNILTLAAEE